MCKGVYWSMVCPHNVVFGEPEKCYQEYLEGVKKTCQNDFNYKTNIKSNKSQYWLFSKFMQQDKLKLM